MTTSGCTRLLDRLEQQGLIERGPHATDRRGLVVRLTPRGRDWLDSILPEHFQSLQTHLWSALEPSEIQTLGQIMRKVRDANS